MAVWKIGEFDLMVYSGLRGLAVILTASIGSASALGEMPLGPNWSEQAEAEIGVVGTRKLALELYAYGKKAKDPLAVLTAASLMIKAPAAQTNRTNIGTVPTRKGSQGNLAHLAPPDRPSMLATARRLAGKNKELLSIIDALASLTPKAPLVGPQWNVDVVAGGATSSYSITFRGGEVAEIAVFFKGDAPVRLRIYDENDREVCVEDGQDQSIFTLYCSWRPKWTGPFHVRIENRGNEDVALRVEAN